jgi:hypothetical protein
LAQQHGGNVNIFKIIFGNRKIVADIDPPDPEELRKRTDVETLVRDTTKVAPNFREQVVQETMARFDGFIGQRAITKSEIQAFMKLEGERPGLQELINAGRLKEYAAAKRRAIDMEVDPSIMEQAEAMHHVAQGLREMSEKIFKNPAVISGDIALGTPEVLHINEYVKVLQRLQDDTSCRFADCSKFIHATHGAPRLEQAVGKEAAQKLLQDAYDAQRTGADTITITVPGGGDVRARPITIPIAKKL